MNQTYSIPQDFVLKGFVLKEVSRSLTKYLDGILNGIIAEVIEIAEGKHQVNIFLLDRSGEEVMAMPWKKWTEGEIEEIDGEPFEVRFYIPPNRSRGLFVSSDNRVFSPLNA